jgi:hypothetical protein
MLSSPRILRFAPVAGLLVLLLAACSGQATATDANSSASANSSTGANSSSSDTGPTDTPSIEGSGLETPQSPGDSGVSVSLAGLPIGGPGDTSTNGNFECIQVAWLGKLPSGTTVTVTRAMVVAGSFSAVDLTAARCPGGDSPACTDSHFSAADNNGGTSCWVAVEWTGTPAAGQPTQTGTVELVGELNCPDTGSTACHSASASLQNSGNSQVDFDFDPPQTDTTPDTGSASPASPVSTNPTSPDTSSP